jgi:hypothetical protein
MLVSLSGIVDLLIILIRLVVDNVEEAELVDALGGGNDAEPVTELLLLEELLGAVNVLAAFFMSQKPQDCRAEHTGTSGSDQRTPGAQ